MTPDRQALRLEVFLDVAEQLSRLSTCDRNHVGAVIVRDGRCVSWGYNGAPPGQPHCRHTADEPCEDAIHAELNAVTFAARQGISTDGGTVCVTLSPCVKCAHALISAGIKAVFYREEYRDRRGVQILRTAGVACRICPHSSGSSGSA